MRCSINAKPKEFDGRNFTLLISQNDFTGSTVMPTLLRKGHLLGAKLRSIRKRNGLTLEELSTRCIQRDVSNAPSVSYLSMIESGKRAPSSELLGLIAAVFQREPA